MQFSMRHMNLAPAIFWVAILWGLPQQSWGEWGSISGRLLLNGEIPSLPPKVSQGTPDFRVCGDREILDYTLKVDPKSRGIADVFVLIRQRPERIHPDLLAAQQRTAKTPPLTVNIKECQFSPYTLIVPTGQPLRITSSDWFSHSVHPYFLINQGWGAGLLEPEDPGVLVPPTCLQKAEILPCKVGSNFFSHMEGWWYVSDHPYHAITNATGEFRIDKLPVGQHTLTIWHSRTGYIEKSMVVDVEENQTTRLDPLHVPAQRFAKESSQ